MKRYHLWLKYGLLALLILGPLLLPGYILTFDMGWTPHLPAPSLGNNGWPFFALLRVVGLVLPSMVVQKLLLLGLFVAAGVGAHRLAEERAGKWAAYLAGLLYVVNPFTYTRLMAGQYLVLLGYALLPWFVRAMVRLLERPDWRRALAVTVWAVVIGELSIHSVGFMAVLLVIIAAAWGPGRWRQLRGVAGWLALGVGGWLVASAHWLAPLILGFSSNAKAIKSFDSTQYAAYATTGGGVGLPLNVASLQGFWGDTQGRYALPSTLGWLFWPVFALLAVLIGLGLWRAVRRRDRLGIALAIAGFVAWVLAMGIAWGPTAPLTRLLMTYLPFYRGYREPQKWAAVLALSYSYLAALGLTAVLERLRGQVRESLALAALLLPLAWTPMLLWGAGGQLRSVDYPASWYQLNQRLNADPGHFKVLMLPWHQYIALNFVGRTVANPTPAFFNRPVLSSANAELTGVASHPPDHAHDVVENQVLVDPFNRQTAGARLAPLGIRYVVLLKTADYNRYGWLTAQTDLKLVAQTSDWQLYRVQEAP